MRITTNSVDNDRFYANASFIPELKDEADLYAENLSNQEIIDLINSKEKKEVKKVERNVIIGSDLDYYGPQRWCAEGNHLYQTNEEGFWNDAEGNIYAEDNGRMVDEVFKSNPLDKCDVKKCRTELNAEEQSWLAAHEQYIDPELDNDPIAKVSYDEEINDGEGHTIVDVVYCTDATEETPEEVRFWKRMVWLIGHSPKKALEFCKKHSCEWLDVETKSWIWELIKEDDTPKFRYAKLLMMRAEKYLATHEKPILEKEEEVKTYKWNVKLFQPIGKNWGFYIGVSDSKVVVRQLIYRTEPWMFKGSEVVVAKDSDIRKDALAKVKTWAKKHNMTLELKGDSNFVHYVETRV